MAEPNEVAEATARASAPAESPAPVPSSVPDPNANKRRHSRVKFPARVLLVDLDESGAVGVAFGGEAMDISRSGVGVCTRRLYYPGRKVLIRISIPQRAPCIKCGVVRHARYCTGGLHHIGIEFCAMPESASVQGWLRSGQALG